MTRKKTKDPRIIVALAVALILLLAIIFYFFPLWDPPHPGVVVSLGPDSIEILEIKKFRYGGTLLCSMCTNYKAEIEAFIDGERICSNENFVLSTFDEGSLSLGVKCPELSEHTGQNVKIVAKGFIDAKFIGQDEKDVLIPEDG